MFCFYRSLIATTDLQYEHSLTQAQKILKIISEIKNGVARISRKTLKNHGTLWQFFKFSQPKSKLKKLPLFGQAHQKSEFLKKYIFFSSSVLLDYSESLNITSTSYTRNEPLCKYNRSSLVRSFLFPPLQIRAQLSSFNSKITFAR